MEKDFMWRRVLLNLDRFVTKFWFMVNNIIGNNWCAKRILTNNVIWPDILFLRHRGHDAVSSTQLTENIRFVNWIDFNLIDTIWIANYECYSNMQSHTDFLYNTQSGCSTFHWRFEIKLFRAKVKNYVLYTPFTPETVRVRVFQSRKTLRNFQLNSDTHAENALKNQKQHNPL